jgi:hypothetical protein
MHVTGAELSFQQVPKCLGAEMSFQRMPKCLGAELSFSTGAELSCFSGIYVPRHSIYRKESTLTNTHRSQNV